MQSDQKVGLALGVLLIGTVAAFFFRNEAPPATRVPILAHADEVNREISEKRLTPYISTIETEDPPREPRTRTASDTRQDNDARTGERKLPRWEDLQADADDPFAGSSPEQHVPAPAPDPIRFEAGSAAAAGSPRTDLNQAWNPVDTANTPLDSLTARTHEVARGDTLSSIAGKYLGSQARFQEIYEANRDQLRDANDLKIGMKLRIPAGRAKSSVTKSAPVNSAPKTKGADSPKTVKEPAAREAATEPAVEDEAVFAESSEPDSPSSPAASEEETVKPVDAEPPKIRFTPSRRRPIR